MMSKTTIMGLSLTCIFSLSCGMNKSGQNTLSVAFSSGMTLNASEVPAVANKPASPNAGAPEVADVKKAAEGIAPTSSDPYQSAHDLFAVAATEEDYDAVIMAYSQEHEMASEKQKAIAITNRGEACLAIGCVEDGFIDREARLMCPQDARLFKAGVFVTEDKPLTSREDSMPLFVNQQGNLTFDESLILKPLKSSTVAVYCDEGGIGDIYFFSRFMKMLKNQGAKIIGVATTPFVQKILDSLRDSAIIDETALFTGKREKFTGATYDYDIHMMSLPTAVSAQGLTACGLNSIPQAPYINAEKERAEFWHNTIAAKKGLHIAYCFAASSQPAGVYRRLDRNIDQAQLEGALTTVDGVATLYCIQGPGTKTTGAIVNVADKEKEDPVPFAHTIALLEALRKSGRGMFVGIDTGPTNAALAVGIKGFVLLPRVADWRWGVAKSADISEDHTPSPWAPSLRLLRQKEQGNWTVPLKHLKSALTETSKQVQTLGKLG